MKTVLVTGGIGSGKSEVCRYMASKGYPVFDCDARAKGLYVTRPDLIEKIDKALGGSLVREDGSLDKALLASRVFGDERALKTLDSIVHPAVQEELESWLSEQSEGGAVLAVVESAIAYKVPSLQALADTILLVDAPAELRCGRVCERSGLSRSEVMARIEAQSRGAIETDYTINNNNSLDELHASVDRYLESIL